MKRKSNIKYSLQKAVNGSTLLLGLITAFGISGVDAQSITPATDGTGTVVTSPNSNPHQLDISGGTRSGVNLFHSFQQLGLNPNQIANFLSNPSIHNILGRVTGGNASVINGLIQVTGGNSNLYLMNPAGMIFGANASLNVPGAFTATTANAIGFGEHQWFNALGSNNYGNLIGNPNQFAFLTSQPGAIFNSGNLAVGQEQSLILLGGTVVNTGTLSAPGGMITITAVPGEKLLRVSPSSSLLSLELPVETKAALTTNAEPLTPLALPALLTGGNLGEATGVTVENGIVKLTRSGTIIPTTPGSTLVSGQLSIASHQPPISTPSINVLGDAVGLIGATIDASGSNGGGTVLIGGDYLGLGTVPNAQVTVVDSTTRINAEAIANGNGGKVIVWADDTTRFYGSITSRGGALGGNGGLVESSGKRSLNTNGASVDASATLGQPGTWLLDPGNINISNAPTTTGTLPIFTPGNINSNVNAGAIANTLNNGTSVTITTAGADPGFGDITLTDSITKTAANAASLTLTGRQFIRPGTATINLVNGGNLTFNINQVNPEANAPSSSIQNAINSIGTVAGIRTINLGVGTYINTPVIINTDVIIRGAGATNTTVDGGKAFRVFLVNPGVTATLENLAIANGNAGTVNNGGGINSLGNLTLSNSIIRNNVAFDGGGISNTGTLTVIGSDIINNVANSQIMLRGLGGGGIINRGGNITISDSQISGNQANNAAGGGINNDQGQLAIANSTFSSNSSAVFGGALYNNNLANATVRNSTFSGNTTNDNGGAINNHGTLSVTNSMIANN